MLWREARWALGFVGLLVFVAIFKNQIAREPQGALLPPLIPYSEKTQDRQNLDFVSPFSVQNVKQIYYRHWLGTDLIGRDILAGVIAGTRTALVVGFGGIFLASIIGVLLGLLAGFYGDKSLKVSFLGQILRGCLIGAFIFYVPIFFSQEINIFFLVLIFIVILLTINKLEVSFLKRNWTFALDAAVLRLVEVLQSVPTILWLLGLITVVQKINTTGLIVLIGCTGWMNLARLTRGEVLRVKTQDFVAAAKSLGLSNSRIIVNHILPNILTPILIAMTFGVAQCILLEAAISFIGLGLPPETVSWGTLLNLARINISAWWLAVFPGFAIFLTVLSFNKIGETLRKI
ncbi:MAG: ABC transporter permease [Saprospiraceae bacterium]|nr:ABC transporter permease [Saprospiraceae bacterium]